MRRRRGLAAALGASVLVVLYIAVAASAVAASAGAGAAGASGLGRGLINHEEDDGLRAMCAALDHDNDGVWQRGVDMWMRWERTRGRYLHERESARLSKL